MTTSDMRQAKPTWIASLGYLLPKPSRSSPHSLITLRRRRNITSSACRHFDYAHLSSTEWNTHLYQVHEVRSTRTEMLQHLPPLSDIWTVNARA